MDGGFPSSLPSIVSSSTATSQEKSVAAGLVSSSSKDQNNCYSSGVMVNHHHRHRRESTAGSSAGNCEGLERLGKNMNLIVEIFATIGETIGDENEEIRTEMLDACREARSLSASLEKTCYLGSTSGPGGGGGGWGGPPTVSGRMSCLESGSFVWLGYCISNVSAPP